METSESERESVSCSPPKLKLFTLPKPPSSSTASEEPSELPEAPLQTSISVPFEWEEVPGKPKQAAPDEPDARGASQSSLELPPRLWNEANFTSTPSPTSVLDGPYMGRRSAQTLSFRKIGGSFRSPEKWAKREATIKERASIFGSMRWVMRREKRDAAVGDISDFSSSFRGNESNGGGRRSKGEASKRRPGFLGLSQSKSHLWATLCESFKQVVPWRRKQENDEKV